MMVDQYDTVRIQADIKNAIVHSNLEELKKLFKLEVDVDDYFNKEEYVLHLSAREGYFDVVAFIIMRGADLEMQDMYDCTPLHYAVAHDRYQIIKLLLRNGAEVDAKDRDAHTPLHHGAQLGKDVVEVLLRNGANINASANDGHTPLHHATCWGRLEAVDFLLHNGALVDARDSLGYTPLYRAAHNDSNNRLVVPSLLGHGANVHARAYDGTTPLHHHSSASGHAEVMEMLLAEGAPINAVDSEGYTPLFHAACNGNIEAVQLLLEKGAHIDELPDPHRSPLYIAVREDHYYIVKMLLQYGADVEVFKQQYCDPYYVNCWCRKKKNNDYVVDSIDLLKEHLLKFACFGKYITLNNAMVRMIYYEPKNVENYAQIMKEFGTLKGIIVHEKLTIVDIMKQTYPHYYRNTELMDNLKEFNYENYPCFGHIIKNKIHEVDKVRIPLLESGIELFKDLIIESNRYNENQLPIMPIEISQIILSHLDNKYLKKFIDSRDDIIKEE